MWDYLGLLTVFASYSSALLALQSIVCRRIPTGTQQGRAFRPSPVEIRKPHGASGGFALPSALEQVGGLVPCRRTAAEQRGASIAVSTPVSYTRVCSYCWVSLRTAELGGADPDCLQGVGLRLFL